MASPQTPSMDYSEEKLINSRKRVRNHGEVFTPSHIVRRMLDLPGINDACQDLTKTFFEPGAGEGAFLVEILRRKLRMVERDYGDRLDRYENYSLLALSTLYGIELLEDNAKRCTMALYEVFNDFYRRQLQRDNRQPKPSVKSSARLIISKNVVHGDFLTKLGPGGNPIVFSEWKVLNLDKRPITLMVQRTEYSLDEIESGTTKSLDWCSRGRFLFL